MYMCGNTVSLPFPGISGAAGTVPEGVCPFSGDVDKHSQASMLCVFLRTHLLVNDQLYKRRGGMPPVYG